MTDHDRAIETLRMARNKLEKLSEWLDAQMRGMGAGAGEHSPCPECGGATYAEQGNLWDGARVWSVYCNGTDCRYHSTAEQTEVDAWAQHEFWCQQIREEHDA